MEWIKFVEGELPEDYEDMDEEEIEEAEEQARQRAEDFYWESRINEARGK